MAVNQPKRQTSDELLLKPINQTNIGFRPAPKLGAIAEMQRAHNYIMDDVVGDFRRPMLKRNL